MVKTRRFKISFSNTDISDTTLQFLKRINNWCSGDLKFTKSEHVVEMGYDSGIEANLLILELPGMHKIHFEVEHNCALESGLLDDLRALFRGDIMRIEPNFEHQFITTTFETTF